MATTQTTEADSGSATARIRHAQSRLSLAQVIEINCKLNLQLLERVRATLEDSDKRPFAPRQ